MLKKILMTGAEDAGMHKYFGTSNEIQPFFVVRGHSQHNCIIYSI